MDVLNKVGSLTDAAGMRPNTSAANVAPSATSSAAPSAPIVQVVPAPKNSEVSNDPQEVSNAISKLNEAVQNIQRGIEFSLDDESGRAVVKVVDRDTGEVIRQLPTEDVLEVSRHLKEFMDARQVTGDSGGQQAEEALGFIMRVQA